VKIMYLCRLVSTICKITGILTRCVSRVYAVLGRPSTVHGTVGSPRVCSVVRDGVLVVRNVDPDHTPSPFQRTSSPSNTAVVNQPGPTSTSCLTTSINPALFSNELEYLYKVLLAWPVQNNSTTEPPTLLYLSTLQMLHTPSGSV